MNTSHELLIDSVRRNANRTTHPEIIAALRALHPQPSSAEEASIAALERGGAACLLTGQQLGVFLGPLFVFSKVVSLLEDARRLSELSGTPVIPIFWLQSEDNDLAEISTFSLLDELGASRTFALEHPGRNAPLASVGSLALGPGIERLLEEVASALGHSLSPELRERLAGWYRPASTFAEAFTAMLRDVFRDSPLLVFDPRHPLVRAQSRSVFHRALSEHADITVRLEERSRELSKAGRDPQVQIRPRSPLLFYHPNGPSGPRFRFEVVSRGGEERALLPDGTTRPFAELVACADVTPDGFSTSALLRPILQDSLLPSAASVLGPSEELYFQQMTGLWPIFGLTPPPTLPRAQAAYLDPRTLRLLTALEIDPAVALAGYDVTYGVIRGRLVPPEAAPERIRVELAADLSKIMERIRRSLRSADAEYERALVRPREKIERALTSLVARYENRIAVRESVTLERFAKLELALFPDGRPQERAYSFLPFWCKYQGRLLTAAKASIQPFERGPFGIILS